MENYTVYMHISPSNKRYIGITSKTVEKRWQNGKNYKGNKYFTSAIEKHGWENFEHIIVAKGLTEEEAKWLEIELIRIWDSSNRDKGYNITKGGESANGWSPSEGTRKKISKSLKGKTFTEEHRKKLSEVKKGHEVSEKTRKKISESTRGKTLSEETRKKMCENNARAKKIICLTTKRIFNTVSEGAEFYGTHTSSIAKCCQGKYKSSGKYNGTPLVWRYIEIIEL